MSAEVKPGYKQTEQGMIPEDWDLRPLGQLVHAVEYGSSAKSSSSGKVPVLRMGNLQEGKIDWSDLVFTDNENEIAKYLLNPGDVLFNRTNTVDLVGKTAIYKGVRPSIFAGYLIRIKEKKDLIDSRYLNYILNSKPAKDYGLKVLSIAVGQANINGQKLKTYPIALPPTVDEQKSIAAAISETEELISSLDQLITKKRDIQQAAMQQLLTGQRRLPGFIEEWEVKRLGSLLTFQVGYPFSSIYFTDGLNAIRLIKNRDLKNDGQPISFVGQYDESYIVKNGDLLIGMDGDFIPCLWNKGVALLNQRVGRILPGKMVNSVFCHYAIKKPLKQIELSTGATTVKHLSHRDIENIEIPLPELDEQTAIANILSDMDAELAAIEARCDKARQLKQGMMQELLTGQIRLA